MIAVKERILRLMKPGVDLTADEIAGALDLPVLSVRPRVCELGKAGILSYNGAKKNRRGNLMTIWRLNDGRD